MQAQSQRSLFCRRFSLALRSLLAFAAVSAASLCVDSPAVRAQANPAAAQGQAVATPRTPARTADTTAPRQARQANAIGRRPSGGQHEGIKVHGHWMIEVRNRDGQLVLRTEFENSLHQNPYSNGLPHLPQSFLSRAVTAGEWGITLGGSSSPCPSTLPEEFANGYGNVGTLGTANSLQFQGPFCVLSELSTSAAIEPQDCATGSSGSGCSQNLEVALDQNNNLSLSGSVTVPNSGTISQVQSIVTTCGPTVSPSSCAAETSPDNINLDSLDTFTGTTLPASNTTTTPCGGTGQISCAVPVSAGQTVTVTVTISFQ